MLPQEFVIPLSLDNLTEAAPPGQYYISASNVLSITELREKLDQAKHALSEEGCDFIFDHFPTFYSLFKKFSQAQRSLQQKAFQLIKRSFALLISNLSGVLDDPSSIDCELQQRMRNVMKMMVFVLVELVRKFQDGMTDASNVVVDAKGKKKLVNRSEEDGWNWYEERNQLFEGIFNLVQLPIKLLWEPPIVEEEFVNLISNVCYKCLEDPSITSPNFKPQRESLFQILGILINNYLHGLSFCVKSVQLLRTYEHLVQPLAQGVIQLATESNCPSVVKEIIREIGNADADQLAADSSGSRSLNLFLVQVAEAVPDLVVPAMDILVQHLSGESTSMRICVLGVLTEILLATLTKENLEESLKRVRDEYLDILEDHLHDVNAFVRSKDLQMWQKLHCAKAIPLVRLNDLLKLVLGRLGDKSSLVKKQAVILVKCLLEGNPYSGQLDVDEIKRQINEEQKKLGEFLKKHKLEHPEIRLKNLEPELRKYLGKNLDVHNKLIEFEETVLTKICDLITQEKVEEGCKLFLQLESNFVEKEGVMPSDPEERFNLLKKMYLEHCKIAVPEISAEILEKKEELEKVVTFLENALEFAQLIDRAVPIIYTLLDSSATTDVLEAINFFRAACKFGFQKAQDGVRKMLYLIHSKEASVKNAVSVAYKQLYFDTDQSGRQHYITALKSLTELITKLNVSQMEALEEVVKDWVKSDIIDKAFIQLLFEKFSLKYPNTSEAASWAALVLIQMTGSEQPKIIKDNVSVLLSQGLGDRGARNFVLARETCKALLNLRKGKSFDDQHRVGRNEEIFCRLQNLIKEGIWRTEDKYFIPFCDEALFLVFALCERPDLFSSDLILTIYEKIKTGKRPTFKHRRSCVTLYSSRNSDNLEVDPKENLDEQEEKLSHNDLAHVYTRFVSLLGTIAANYVKFLEGPVLNELKRRNQVDFDRKMKRCHESMKNVSLALDKTLQNESEELELNRAAADDQDTVELKKMAENEIVSNDGLLAKFTPILETIIKQPKKFNYPPLQNAAVSALGMFMQVSSVVCGDHMQLLATVTANSHQSALRQVGLMAIWALQFRFPNTLEPWTETLFKQMLKDKDVEVRRTALHTLTHLIVNEMVKPRGHLASLAEALVDNDMKIERATRHFFREYSTKGNGLFYALPGLISNLTQSNQALTEEQFRYVMKFLIGLITKDRQMECLVEKLCQYFESATTERQWTDLAYCLSLLNYNEKSLRKIYENFRCFGNKLYLAEVYEVFCTIVATASKNPAKDKNLLEELNGLIKEYRAKSCEDHQVPVTLSKRREPKTVERARMARRKLKMSSDEEGNEEDIGQVASSDDDLFVKKSEMKKKGLSSVRKRRIKKRSSESDSEEDQQKYLKVVKKSAKKVKGKRILAESESDTEVSEKRALRSTRKRK